MDFGTEWVLHLVLLVPVAAAIWLLLLHRGQTRYDRVFDPPLRRRYAPAPAWRRRLAQLAGLTLAAVLALIALARPRWGATREITIQRQHDLVIALDVSRSMLARDVFPDRLERAKALLYDLVREAADDRVAIVAFRGGARRLCPLTRDTGFLLQTLAGAGVHSAPPGPTDLAEAIRMAMDSFDTERPGQRTVLMISDGEDLGGDLDAAMKTARDQGVAFLTIGIGTATGAPIPDERSPSGYQTHDGQRVITRMDPDTLSRIAMETGGAYIPLGDGIAELGVLYRDHLRPADAAAHHEAVIRQHAERFQWFLLPAVVGLLGVALLSRGRPSHRGGVVAILTVGLTAAALPVAAGPTNNTATQSATPVATPRPSRPARPAREAMRAWRRGDYPAAAAGFEAAAAAETDPSLQTLLHYNAACARYQAGDYEAAARGFAEVLARTPEADLDTRHHLAAAHLEQAAAAAEPPASADAAADRRQTLLQAARQAQAALMDNPAKDAWRVTLDGLDQAVEQTTEQERILRVLEAHGQRPPADLANEILRRQRALRHDLEAADRLPLPERVRQREALAAEQRATADLLLPLAPALQNDAHALQRAAGAAHTLRQAAEAVEDVTDTAPELMQQGEAGFYGLWKELTDYRSLLDETLTQQTDAAEAVDDLLERAAETVPPALADQQRETLDLNRRFQERFRQAPDVTPPPDSEFESADQYRDHLLDLARMAAQAQDEAAGHLDRRRLAEARSAQRDAAGILDMIRRLLPPPPEQESSDDAQPPDPDENDGEDQQEGDDEEKSQPPPDDGAPQDSPPEESQAPEPEPSPDEIDPDQIEALLNRIQQREHEHLEDQRRRAIEAPPVGRDW